MFGLHEEAAILKLSQATKLKNPDQKIKALKSCLVAHYQSAPSLSRDAAIIQQQIRLLEVQQPINQSDIETAAKAKEIVGQLKAHQQQQQQKSSPTISGEFHVPNNSPERMGDSHACPKMAFINESKFWFPL